MTKVYVVVWYHWEDTSVCSVHATEEGAKAEAARLNETHPHADRPCTEYDYEEHEVKT